MCFEDDNRCRQEKVTRSRLFAAMKLGVRPCTRTAILYIKLLSRYSGLLATPILSVRWFIGGISHLQGYVSLKDSVVLSSAILA